MYASPTGEPAEIKGHMGSFYEIQACRSSSSLTVYHLIEVGRRVMRSAVYTTDSRKSLLDLQQSADKRDTPWTFGAKNAAGVFFGGLFASSGALLARAGVGGLKSSQVQSLSPSLLFFYNLLQPRTQV